MEKKDKAINVSKVSNQRVNSLITFVDLCLLGYIPKRNTASEMLSNETKLSLRFELELRPSDNPIIQ